MSKSYRAVIALFSIGLVFVLTALVVGLQPPQTVRGMLQFSDTMSAISADSPLPAATVVVPTAVHTLARREYLGMPAEKVVPTTFLPGQGPTLGGKLVYSGRRLDFYLGNYSFTSEQVQELGTKAEYALGYMQRRFDQTLTRRVSVGVYSRNQAPSRSTRGIAHTQSEFLYIYYNPNEDVDKAFIILTHELAHQLQADAYGTDVQSRADLVLLEGLATWISGEYWLSLSGAPSWQAHAQDLVRAGYGSSIVQNGQSFAAAASYASSDTAYELWAGFVDYLTRTYGWDTFNELYCSGRGRTPGSANYEGIYGKTFNELVQEWYATLH